MAAYIIIGVVIFLILGTAAGRKVLPLPTWRIGAGIGAMAAFAGGAYFAIRNAWPVAAVFIFVGLWLAMSSRIPRARVGEKPRTREVRRTDDRMSAAEARSILGVGEDATREEIQTAYKRLMIRVHPDNGGAPGLAVRLNAARDRLLKG